MVRWIKDAPSRIIPATVLLTDEQKSVLRAFTGIGAALTLLVMGWGYFQWGSEAARIAALPPVGTVLEVDRVNGKVKYQLKDDATRWVSLDDYRQMQATYPEFPQTDPLQ
jgi:hypothetical protein